jgi:O-antigen/teichoic acid export membrane protein
LSVIYVFSVLISYSDAVVIAAFLPIEAVTFFAIAGNLRLQAGGAAASLSYLMTPRVSALASMGSKRVGEEILAVAGIATLVVAPIATTFWFRGESFITLWMGSEYGPASGEVLRILSIVLWLGASRSVVISSLIGLARQRTLIPGFAVEAACNLALSVVLVRPLGIVGVALGTLIPSVLVNLGYIPGCLSKAVGVPVRLFHRNAILLPTLACLPFALASVAIERFIPAANLAIFLVQVISILPLVPITAWFLCLTAAEKEQVRSEIRNVVGR